MQMGRFYNNKSESGETLIEALIALAITTAIATGIVAAVITAFSGTNTNKRTNFAGNFAQEGSNLIKDLAAQDFTTFKSTYTYNSSDVSKNTYYFGDDQTLNNNSGAFVPCSGSSSTGYNLSDSSGQCSFLRQVYINTNGCDQRITGASCTGASDPNKKCPDGIFTATVVSWNDSKCGSSNKNCHKSEIDSCLTNLNVLPTLP